MFRTITLAAACFAALWLASPSPAQEPAPMPQPQPAPAEKPSAEMITDAEKDITPEPPKEPGEEPLPPMDNGLPGEQNIFGNDLFGTPGTVTAPPEPVIPPRPPVLEDPKEAERKTRVQFRKVKAVLDRDPQLIALQELAATAPTPEDNRAARRAYYALFFSKVRKADPKLSAYADALERSSLAGLYQTRIEPTLALNPPPQPQPQAKFIPPSQIPGSAPAAAEEPAPRR